MIIVRRAAGLHLDRFTMLVYPLAIRCRSLDLPWQSSDGCDKVAM
jgi:hypothetical protein